MMIKIYEIALHHISKLQSTQIESRCELLKCRRYLDTQMWPIVWKLYTFLWVLESKNDDRAISSAIFHLFIDSNFIYHGSSYVSYVSVDFDCVMNYN